MTRERAIMELKLLQPLGDYERAHVEADTVLCKLLIQLGYADVVTEYEQVPKWFA